MLLRNSSSVLALQRYCSCPCPPPTHTYVTTTTDEHTAVTGDPSMYYYNISDGFSVNFTSLWRNPFGTSPYPYVAQSNVGTMALQVDLLVSWSGP